MPRKSIVLFAALAALAAEPLKLEIPYQKFVLTNGLTLIVHEDHKAPIVAVNIWYHVGSKNEKRGRTGFAHLFEHLMFNGSEHFNQDYFKVLEKIGATDLNGTTNDDRTNYFQNVPTTALDTVLWMESDRMGHLLGAIDQAELDEQRGVVQNEKRQGENQPYGRVYDAHRREHLSGGSSLLLDRHRLDGGPQRRQRWRTCTSGSRPTTDPPTPRWCWPATSTPRPRARRWRSTSARSRPGRRWRGPRLGGPAHGDAAPGRCEDRVPQARLYKVWNTPQSYTADVNPPRRSAARGARRRAATSAPLQAAGL